MVCFKKSKIFDKDTLIDVQIDMQKEKDDKEEKKSNESQLYISVKTTSKLQEKGKLIQKAAEEFLIEQTLKDKISEFSFAVYQYKKGMENIQHSTLTKGKENQVGNEL